MPSTTVKSARKRLGDLVREVNEETVAVEIVGKRGSAVLISTAHYAALREATFLLRSPELMDSLRREMQRTLLEAAAQEAAEATAEIRAPRTRTRTKRKKRKKRKKLR
ncbi:type II toxin-antitoxin system prevent-host-death family antitoxin [Rhodococcus sp. Z13]|uniref:Type II toxin-antitoxin system prevent-host-death family antitoxin n=1 Tax=Rhodococcus sacchari TaxID=2962047 RepID=A0ACD4DAY9_9NOCA|nr:type II toxin-antitoxin system prevent-host-death family antitoxin [Rhodococcus sp. Z13]UYP17168.1 type II toxin-antitoxin system prevent-host-death family antitoxin [Rhodococcus sp. Z13]